MCVCVCANVIMCINNNNEVMYSVCDYVQGFRLSCLESNSMNVDSVGCAYGAAFGGGHVVAGNERRHAICIHAIRMHVNRKFLFGEWFGMDM